MLTITKLEWQKRLRGAGLTPTEYMVLMTISTYTDERGRNAHPGWARLKKDTGLDVRTIKKAVVSVQVKGWLVQVEEGGNEHAYRKANVYALTVPEGGQPMSPLDVQQAAPAPEGRGTSGAPRGTSGADEGGHWMTPHQINASDHSSDPKFHEQSSIARTSFTSDPQAESPASNGFADQGQNPGPFTIAQRMQLIDDIVLIAQESSELARRSRQPESRNGTDTLGHHIDRVDDAMDTFAAHLEEFFSNRIGDEMALVDLIANGKWTIPHRCVDRYEAGIELNKLINTAGLGHLTPADNLEVSA